jgi:hypothetical protein
LKATWNFTLNCWLNNIEKEKKEQDRGENSKKNSEEHTFYFCFIHSFIALLPLLLRPMGQLRRRAAVGLELLVLPKRSETIRRSLA